MFTYSLLFYLECRPLLKLLPLFLRLPYPIYRVLWSKIFSSQCNLPQAREITEKCLLEFNVVMIYDAEVWHSFGTSVCLQGCTNPRQARRRLCKGASVFYRKIKTQAFTNNPFRSTR
jgi:hypothetical protein